MEYLILLAVMLILFLFWVIANLIRERQSRQRFLAKLKNEYGKRPEKQYPVERLLSMERHLEEPSASQDTYILDDITCNDLDFERLFLRIDRCFSAAGEEELYRILRTSCFDPEELQNRRKLIEYFSGHEEERIRLQMYFAGIGRSGKYSVRDYLDLIRDLDYKSPATDICVIGLMIASVILMFFNGSVGLFCLIGLLIFNFITYFREKEKISPYITTFSYLLRLLVQAKGIESCGIEEIREICDRIRERREKFRSFERFSGFLTGGDQLSSNPMDVVMDYLRMGLHLNIMKFYSMLKTVRQEEKEMIAMMDDLGYIEAMISAGEFAASLPYYCWAETGAAENEKERFSAKELYHPLVKEAVANDVAPKGNMLLTGSNASGKSTFLKTVAIAQILAQSLGIVPAREYITGFYRVCTSMALRDDLSGGRSYFIVEIESLKRIADDAKTHGRSVMCFVDEVLRGTNTVERISASTQILESIAKSGAFCFAATHDIELTELLESCFENYHFREEIRGDDVCFDYKLRQGRAGSRNAIRLLSVMGYDEQIIDKANARAEHFLQTGEWK
ncbi:MAG: hypothetical protein K5739_05650 [Lachnospiraceae bacterium]|nr:hypothetical protein [Lachnospiraceae bacterium]